MFQKTFGYVDAETEARIKDHKLQQKLQAETDEVTARALQKTYEEEERNRKAKLEAERERRAYQKRMADEKKGEELVYQISKKCPKCQWSIQKIDGCEHVSILQRPKFFLIATLIDDM